MTPTDAELNEKVAAIAGWTDVKSAGFEDQYSGTKYYTETGCTEHNPLRRQLPSYATDLNAVVAVLQKSTAFCSLEFVSRDQWTCTLTYASPKPEGCETFEATDTLARAICLALCAARADAARKEPPAKAHGCEVGE